MKLPPAEKFFSGTQLQLAQAIENRNREEAAELARTTDLNKPGAENMTLLMYALLAATDNRSQSLGIVTDLVKAGADPLQQIPDFGSPAGAMARSNNPAYMKALLDGGLNPNAVIQYQPIIIDAATDNSFAVLKLLVSAGADVNQPDSAGKTAIVMALAEMQLDQVEYLLNHGADPTVKAKMGVGFNEWLYDVIERERNSNQHTRDKLEQIRQLAVSKGMQWPPEPR